MEVSQPQLSLFVERGFDGPDEYALHAVTRCGRSNFRADGHLPLPATLDENGTWNVTLKIKQDTELPDFVVETPVVHSLELGSLPGGAKEANIQVHLQVEKLVQLRGMEEEKPKAEVHTTSAQEESRPGM